MYAFVLAVAVWYRMAAFNAIFKHADIRIAFLTDAGDNQIAFGDKSYTGHLASKLIQFGNAVNYFFHWFYSSDFFILPFSAWRKKHGTVKGTFSAKYSAEVNGGRKNCRISVGGINDLSGNFSAVYFREEPCYDSHNENKKIGEKKEAVASLVSLRKTQFVEGLSNFPPRNYIRFLFVPS